MFNVFFASVYISKKIEIIYIDKLIVSREVLLIQHTSIL